jgi:hypothetical protein
VDREVGPIAGSNDPNARTDRFKGGEGHYALYLLVERLP